MTFLDLDAPFDGAGKLDLVAIDRALDLGVLADLHAHAAHIAVDLAVDLNVLGALQLACDLEGFADEADPVELLLFSLV